MRINKLLDFIDRVGWTAIQAAAGAVITELTSPGITWLIGAKFVGITAAIAVCKVLIAQNTGKSGLGDGLPGASVVNTSLPPGSTGR
jgi:hypothetical protein